MGESRKVLNLVIQSVTVGAVEMFGGGAAAWRTIAFIYCIIGIITNTLAVFSVKELSDEELKDDSVAGEEDDKLSFKQTIKLLFSNKYFSMICVIYILQQLRASMVNVGIFFMTYVLLNKNLFGVFSWANNIPLIIALAVTPALVSKMKGMYKLNNKGDLYPLTSHQFRSTFVRELIKRKVPIAMIMKQYSHISIEMTAHYLTLQEEEVKEIYSDMILSPESKIAGLRAKEIKGKLDDLFHGKTEDEIDDVISGLAKTMSFNPLPTGVCLYDFRRGNCTDGDGCFFYNCPNYITEVQFYPILKDELDLLEKEMARLKELGQEPAYQVQAVKYKYLKPLVESLEVQLNGKESVG